MNNQHIVENDMATALEKERIQEIKKRGLPVGQALLEAGFKEVSFEQLMEQFRLKELILAKIKNMGAKLHKNGIIVNMRSNYVYAWAVIQEKGFFKNQEDQYINASLIRDSLDSYVSDKIPEYVLERIEIARELGAKEFQVAYPIMGDRPQNDPVVLAVLGNNFIEIAYWE